MFVSVPWRIAMKEDPGRAQESLPVPEPALRSESPIDTDQSGNLAIGLMLAVVALIALMTLALFISIP
jgi:hypothetical protein